MNPPGTRQRTQIALLFLIAIFPFELNGWYNPLLADRPGRFWVVETLTWVVLPAALLAVGLHRRLFTLPDLGISARVRGVRYPVLLALLLLPAVPIVLYHLDRWSVEVAAPHLFPHNYGAVPFHYTQMLPDSGPRTDWLRLLATLHLVLTAGFVEEIFYRGLLALLFPNGWTGAMAYIVVSAAIFASTHWEGGVYTLTEAALFGIAAAILFRLTRNLWPLILAHVIIDFLWFTGG